VKSFSLATGCHREKERVGNGENEVKSFGLATGYRGGKKRVNK